MTIDSITRAQEQIAKLQADTAAMQAIAPHIIGEPRHLIPNGRTMMVCYQLDSVEQLKDLIAGYPPIAGITYRGTFAGYKEVDQYHERDGAITAHTDGIYWSVEQTGYRGSLTCNWFSETPAGRVNVRVEFKATLSRAWPYISAEYGKDPGFGRPRKLLRWEALNMPAGTVEKFRYGSGDSNTPGHVAFFFAADDSAKRDAFIDALCSEAK